MLKRTLLTWACLLFVCSLFAQQTYLSCNFNEGIPSSFTLSDKDGLDPSNDMKKLGFAIGIPWIATKVDADSNMVACSTSWYRKAGTSDDWMITPKLHIASGKAVISWRAKAKDEQYSDGYIVYISVTDTALNSFDKTKPLFSVREESGKWTEHNVDLSAYNGKDVYIAFVNNSHDRSCLYIDDIFVGVPSSVDFTSDLGTIIGKSGNITVSGKAFTNSGKTVTGFTVGYSCNGKTYTKEYPSTTITSGQKVAFAFDEPLVIEPNQTLSYDMWIQSGEDKVQRSYQISAYAHKVLAEEATGTWCGWCVRGHVYMEYMAKNYPDNFVGIAVHNGDIMSVNDYDKAFGAAFPHGYPTVLVNRDQRYLGNPAEIESYAKKVLASDLEAGIELKADYDYNTNMLTAKTRLFFINNHENATYRLAYMITENNINVDNSKYSQRNYYSGGGNGAMGGYENLGDPVPGNKMHYQMVARKLEGTWNGIEGSVPATIVAAKPVSYDHTFILPSNILNKEEATLVVVLLDNKTGLVVNAEQVPLKGIITGLTATQTDDQCNIELVDKTLSVKTDRAIEEVFVCTIDGRIVKQAKAEGTAFNMSLNGLNGIYLVKVVAGGQTTTRKIVIMK